VECWVVPGPQPSGGMPDGEIVGEGGGTVVRLDKSRYSVYLRN
jgi:hypothetical protein